MTTKSLSTFVERDSGYGATAKAAEDHDQRVPPHGGTAAAARPTGSRVSGSVMVLDEQGGSLEDESVPGAMMTLSPAMPGDPLLPTLVGSTATNGHDPHQTPPMFSVGPMVSPEEERNPPGSAGATKMVALERRKWWHWNKSILRKR